MKRPKKTKRYCPYCKKQTEQKVKEQSKGKASSLKRGGKVRIRLRGLWRGIGNKGRYSRLKNQQKEEEKQLKRLRFLTPAQSVENPKTKRKVLEPQKLLLE
jgi:ribosomal protein L44E